MCLENSRLKLTNGEMNGDAIDVWGPGNIEWHSLNYAPYKAGFAGGSFSDGMNFHFAVHMNQWFGFPESCFAYRCTAFRGAVAGRRSYTQMNM